MAAAAAADADAAFSIRGYAASMRTEAGAEGTRPLAVEDLPPMQPPSFRWWADELASVVASASASPRRSLGKTRPPKKRSISDLFAAAPPSDIAGPSGGGGEHLEVDDDEALCAIVMRAKEEKKRKRRLEKEATAAAAAEGSGAREPEGIFAIRKEALDKPILPDGIDTQASKEPEAVHLLGKEKEKMPDVKKRKQAKNNDVQKKADSVSYIESKKANKVGKPRDLEKMLPLHSILKKYTKHTSVKMVKDKHGCSKGTEVIELRRKSVKRVKFSEANDVCKQPKQQRLQKLLSDAMASSSSSSSSSLSSSSTGMSGEVEKGITAESSSSHRPEEALTESKEAYENIVQKDSPKLPLIDLNEALPESTGVDYTYDSCSEVPNVSHTQEENLNSSVQVLDGRANQRELSIDSFGLRCHPPATDPEGTGNSRSVLLYREATEASGIDIVRPQLSLRDLAETHRDCSGASVKDTRPTYMSPRTLPDRPVHDPPQQYQNRFSADLNHGGSQLSSGGNISAWRSREYNLSRSETPHFNSGLNVQHDGGSSSTGQTVRLMGKDLAVSASRAECSVGMAEKHAGTSSFSDHLKTNVLLPQQGQSFYSLQSQSFPTVSVNPSTTNHVSAYSANSSQVHFGYRTPHDLSHPSPAANAFSTYRSPYGQRLLDFSKWQPNQHFLSGCPPLPNHGSAAFHQNSLPPWRNYSYPYTRTEPPTSLFLLASRQHGASASVSHVNMSHPLGVHPASSLVRPHNPASSMQSHQGRIVQEASDIRRDAALVSRNSDSRQRRVVPENVRRDVALPPRNSDGRTRVAISDNVRTDAALPSRGGIVIPDNVRTNAALPSRNPDAGTASAVPDHSKASSSMQFVQKRSGPVKLAPGAKHILVPSDTAGDDNSLPVYSCVSIGSRRANASTSQNKGA